MTEQPAWDAPETRRSLAAYRLGALRWLAGGLASAGVAVGLSAYAVRVLQRPGLGVFIVAATILGLIGVITGAGALLRARQFRRALQGAPWQGAELRVAGAHLRLILPTEQTDDDLDNFPAIDVKLMPTSRWRVRAVVGYRDQDVLVCPDGEAGFVLSAPGMNNLYGLRRLGGRLAGNRPGPPSSLRPSDDDDPPTTTS